MPSKYGNAVQEDLWRALTQQAITDNVPLPVDVETIMKTWTLVMGYPVVTVLRDYDTGSAVLIQVNISASWAVIRLTWSQHGLFCNSLAFF